MKKALSLKAKTIVSLVLFAVAFIALTLVASFCDLAISKILTKDSLKDGAYICSDVFALFFEAVGSCPIYLVPAVCGAIVFWCALRRNYKLIAGVGAVVVFGGFFLAVMDITNYYTEAITASLNGGIPLKRDFTGDFYIHLVEAFVALTESVLLIVAWSRVKKETNEALFKWVFVCILVVAGYLIVNFVKGPVGRVRFRTMNAVGDTNYSSFTDWWVSNGKNAPYSNLPSDQCKSFPSGHTYSAGVIYAIIVLPDCVKSLNDKKWARPLLYTISIVFTGLVGISRIVAGAHFMSDVLFGGTIPFVLAIIGREIFVCKFAHIKALFNKPYAPLKFVEPERVEKIDYDKMA